MGNRKSYLEKFAKKHGHKNTGNNKGTNRSFSSLGSLGSALKTGFDGQVATRFCLTGR